MNETASGYYQIQSLQHLRLIMKSQKVILSVT